MLNEEISVHLIVGCLKCRSKRFRIDARPNTKTVDLECTKCGYSSTIKRYVPGAILLEAGGADA